MHHRNLTLVECHAQAGALYELFGHDLVRDYDVVERMVGHNGGMRAIIDCLFWKGIRLSSQWHGVRCRQMDIVDANWFILPFMAHASHHTNYITAGIARNVYRHCTQPDIQSILIAKSFISENGWTGSCEPQDFMCEHLNAHCDEYLGSHGSFSRCIHFPENIMPLKHVDNRLGELWGTRHESRKEAPPFMQHDIRTLKWHYITQYPTLASACAPTDVNPFGQNGSSTEGPNITNLHSWLSGVYTGMNRSWTPPGSNNAVAKPWLEVVQHHLSKVF